MACRTAGTSKMSASLPSYACLHGSALIARGKTGLDTSVDQPVDQLQLWIRKFGIAVGFHSCHNGAAFIWQHALHQAAELNRCSLDLMLSAA